MQICGVIASDGPDYLFDWDGRNRLSSAFVSGMSKRFHIVERVSAELRAEAYNLTSLLNRANPDLVITSSTFSQALQQTITTGWQVELGMRIIF